MTALPLGVLTDTIVRTVSARPEDAGYLAEIGLSIAALQSAHRSLVEAEKHGGALPMHSIESLRFHGQRVQGISTFLLKRAMNGACHQRAGGSHA